MFSWSSATVATFVIFVNIGDLNGSSYKTRMCSLRQQPRRIAGPTLDEQLVDVCCLQHPLGR